MPPSVETETIMGVSSGGSGRGDERGLAVAIAGGGIAGLEALIGLRELAGDAISITLVSREPDFTYRPQLVEEPFTPTPATRRELAPIAEEFGARLVRGAVERVAPTEHELLLDDDSRVSYDVAVICVGARPRPAFQGAASLFGPEGAPPMDEQLRTAAAHPSRRLALVVPPGASWTLPLYETALLAERRARELSLEVEALIVTPEVAPLVVFGPIASQAVAELLRARRIAIETDAYASERDGEITIAPAGLRLEAGSIVSLPVLDGPRIDGLSADERGFIPVDEHSRVLGVEDSYAAGDGTNFPIKQGGLGTQQADAAAEQIAARAGTLSDPAPFHPVLRGKLLTGEESMSLSHDLTGGAGEGRVSADYLWWPPHKVSGRYLAPWLEGERPHPDPEPPRRPLEVEVALPKEWHRDPVALGPYELLGPEGGNAPARLEET